VFGWTEVCMHCQISRSVVKEIYYVKFHNQIFMNSTQETAFQICVFPSLTKLVFFMRTGLLRYVFDRGEAFFTRLVKQLISVFKLSSCTHLLSSDFEYLKNALMTRGEQLFCFITLLIECNFEMISSQPSAMIW